MKIGHVVQNNKVARFESLGGAQPKTVSLVSFNHTHLGV